MHQEESKTRVQTSQSFGGNLSSGNIRGLARSVSTENHNTGVNRLTKHVQLL